MSDCTKVTMTEAVAPFANESQESLLAMRIWTLLQTATSLGVEPLTVEELVRASGLHAKLNRREREALDIVLDVQRAHTSGNFLSADPSSLRANGRQFYDIKDKSAVILYLQCLVSNYLGRTLYGDNGVDPILGAPYPPINYELTIHSTQPRLRWTVPDVLINLTIEAVDGGGVATLARVTATNYEWPTWDSGTTYIENSAVTRSGTKYRSLQYNNTNHAPESSPDWWEVDYTVFRLHTAETEAVIGASGPPGAELPITADYDEDEGHPSFTTTRGGAGPATYNFYMSAQKYVYVPPEGPAPETYVADGVPLKSNLISVVLMGGGGP